jgi:Rad3-related DNA helicase
MCLRNMASIVPGGMVVFYPSYAYEAEVYESWLQSGVLRGIEQRKQVRRFSE